MQFAFTFKRLSTDKPKIKHMQNRLGVNHKKS